MASLKLKVVHRLLLLGMLDGESKEGHTLSELNKYLKLVDRVQFKEADVKELDLRIEENAWKWKAETDKERKIDLSDEQLKTVCDLMKKKDDKKEFTAVNLGPIMELAEQVGYKCE